MMHTITSLHPHAALVARIETVQKGVRPNSRSNAQFWRVKGTRRRSLTTPRATCQAQDCQQNHLSFTEAVVLLCRITEILAHLKNSGQARGVQVHHSINCLLTVELQPVINSGAAQFSFSTAQTPPTFWPSINAWGCQDFFWRPSPSEYR